MGGGGGGGGGGREGYTHSFWVKSELLTKIVYCLETQRLVVTTKWLQLSHFTVWEPNGYN